ncbi:bifunctional riboflavin kinase/FAD synthetase [Geitlerinema sp. CS-897]|nr:bifunctional riboflavin kinase/FAD synthetase [Geitlerinema sp. CS-897]
MWVTSSLTTVLKPAKVALGNFDGVHLGHQQVIREVLHDTTPDADVSLRDPRGANLDRPRSVDLNSKDSKVRGGGRTYTTVVTFNPHPQEFFSGRKRLLLTPVREKVDYLKTLGVDQVVLLPFDRELVNLTPEAFVEKILVRHLEAKHVSVGENFRFGRNRSGSVVDLQDLAAAYGIRTSIVGLCCLEDDRISSSIVRHALELGNLAQANRLLGRPYRLIGTVVKGQQLGRQLGFPTANLQLPPDKFLPRWGVYSTWVEIDNCETVVPGVANFGCRPTVAGDRPTVEVHLLDWQGDLYDRTVTLHLTGFLRPEHKFDSIDSLKTQIQQDCESAREQLAQTTFAADRDRRTPSSEYS